MQEDPGNQERPAEPRKEVSERKRRFQIVKLEERIAPGGGNGKGTNVYCGETAQRHCYRF
jgi:hypothetical protein